MKDNSENKELFTEILVTFIIVFFVGVFLVFFSDKETVTPKSISDSMNVEADIDKVEIDVKKQDGDMITGEIIGVGPTVSQENTPFKMNDVITVKFNDEDKNQVSNMVPGEHIVMDVDPTTDKNSEIIEDVVFVERH